MSCALSSDEVARLERIARDFRRLETFWRKMAVECRCKDARKAAREMAVKNNRFARQAEAKLARVQLVTGACR